MKSLKDLKDDKAALMEIVNIVLALVLIVVVGAIGIFIADATVTQTSTTVTAGAYASGTYNFTGAGVTGERVNITNATGSVMCYSVNTTGIGKPVGCLVLRADGGSYPNTSVGLATQLKAQLQADADINSSITVTNTTPTNVIVTWNTVGNAGNVAVSTNVTNGSWTTGANLVGGANKSSVYDMQANILSAGQTGSSFIIILIIASIGGLAIAYLLGMVGKKKGRSI